MKVRTLPFMFHLVLLLSATTAQASLSSRSDTPGGFHQCVETIVAPGNVDWRNTSANAAFSHSNDHALVSKRQAMRRDSPSRADNAPTPHLLSIRDISVRFTQLPALASSGIALVIGSLVAGCGGGGGSTDALAQSSSTSSSSSSASTTAGVPAAAGDSAIIQSGSTATGGAEAGAVASSNSNPDAGNAAAPADATATPAAAHVADTIAMSSHSGLGTNLAQVSYYGSQYPTIDFMKRAGNWLTQCTPSVNKDCKAAAWDTGEESKLDLDADGWVKSLPAAGAPQTYRYATTAVLGGGSQPVGKYIVRYDGQGTLIYGGIGTKVAAESTAGRDVVNVTSGTSFLFLSVTATTPSNYVRNIRVYAPGGACSGDMSTYVTSAAACTSGSFVAFENFPAGSAWFPKFLADVKGFRTLRFMDWGQTNLTNATAWTDRTPPTYRNWNRNAGVPIEAMFDLAKTVGADPWMNIPPYATDDYIHQFGKLAHQNLGAGQTLNLEYANEMWNYAFPATSWALSQAKAALASSAAKGVDQNSLLRNWYAQRLVQACTIVKGEFGADASRVRCVANTQAANAWDTTQVLSCPYAGGACAKSIDVVAIAPYFGQYIANTANRSLVSTWYADADGGLTKMFQEIVGTDAPNAAAAITPLASIAKVPGGGLTQVKGWMVTSQAAAAKYGKPLWAYEGGQSLLAPATDTDATLLNLMIAANRDARMGAAYQTMLQDWVAAGGQTFALFTDIATPSKFGFWGLRESQWDTAANSPKWRTALQWRDQTPCWWTGC